MRRLLLPVTLLTIGIFFAVLLFIIYRLILLPQPPIVYTTESTIPGYSFTITNPAALHKELVQLYAPRVFVDTAAINTIVLRFIAASERDDTTGAVTTSNGQSIVPIVLDVSKLPQKQSDRNEFIEEIVLITFYNHLMNIMEYDPTYRDYGIIIPEYERQALHRFYGRDVARRHIDFLAVKSDKKS